MHLTTIIKSVSPLCQRFSLIQAAQYCVFLLCIFSICCRFSVSAAQYSSFLSRPQGADRRQPPSGGCLCIFIHFCICYLSPAAPCAAGPTAPDAADNRRKTDVSAAICPGGHCKSKATADSVDTRVVCHQAQSSMPTSPPPSKSICYASTLENRQIVETGHQKIHSQSQNLSVTAIGAFLHK